MPSVKDTYKKASDVYRSVSERAEELKLRDGHKKSAKVVDSLAKDSLFFDELENRLEKTVAKLKFPSGKVSKSPQKGRPVANLLLSDLHFGSMLGTEVVFQYGALEESRRFASVIQQTISSYSAQADAINLYILGDIIQNQLHDARDGAPLAAQACSAIHLLSQGIAHLGESFKQVDVYCSTGNHGRFTSRHHDRAVHQKWDSLEQVIYYALARMFASHKRVRIHVNKSHFITHVTSGHHVFATHGDTIMNVGSPNKSINVKGVEGMLSRLNTNLDNKIKLFLCGHTHSPTIHVMNNGTMLIMNGALVPSDEFAATQGWLTTTSGQWGWLNDEKAAAYDLRFMKVGPEQDKLAELNKIITPYEY